MNEKWWNRCCCHPQYQRARDCRPNQNPMWYEFFPVPVHSISILIKFILSSLNTFVVTSHIIYTQWPYREGDDAVYFVCFFFLRSNEMLRQWLWPTYRWPHLERMLTDAHEWAVQIFLCKKSNCFFLCTSCSSVPHINAMVIFFVCCTRGSPNRWIRLPIMNWKIWPQFHGNKCDFLDDFSAFWNGILVAEWNCRKIFRVSPRWDLYV